MRRTISQCPVCEAPLETTELSCFVCDTRMHGIFPPPPLARLPHEQQEFIETFVRCRGVIRDVERALGISYPTVRARLDAAVAALESVLAERERSVPGPAASPPEEPRRALRRREVLRQVAEGLLDPEDAAEALRRL